MYQRIKPIDDCYKDLANAIVVQAADDYRRIIRGKKLRNGYTYKDEKKKLIAFFKGGWCQLLTNVPGREILNRLDKEYEQEQKKRKELKNEKYKRYSKSCF